MLKDYLCHIANTLFTYQEQFYAPWDNLLCRLLDEGKIVGINPHTVSFSFEGRLYGVWISNRWYSYAHLYALNEKPVAREIQFRPRFKTMRRLHALTSEINARKRKHLRQEIYFQNTSHTKTPAQSMDINAGWLQRIPDEERSDDQ